MKSKYFYTHGKDKLHEYEEDRPPEIKVWSHTFTGPDDREAIMEKLQICSQFDMRYRGLFQFYSDDLAAYKRKKGTGKHANEFLRILAKHFTDNLEDTCPPSWQACQPPFWEELIHSTFPQRMRISTKQRESENFLQQLNRFVRWLDQRTGTSWHMLVQEYAEAAKPELLLCERLLNRLISRDFPTIHQNNWNLREELAAADNGHNQCKITVNSVFQVEKVSHNLVTITNLDTSWTYQLVNMPCRMVRPGMLLQGNIGKKHGDLHWTWLITEGIYPAKAKDYIVFVD